MNSQDRLKMGLRILLISTPLLACCCPAMPIARIQTDEVIQVSDQDLEKVLIDQQCTQNHSSQNTAQSYKIQQQQTEQDKSARPATNPVHQPR